MPTNSQAVLTTGDGRDCTSGGKQRQGPRRGRTFAGRRCGPRPSTHQAGPAWRPSGCNNRLSNSLAWPLYVPATLQAAKDDSGRSVGHAALVDAMFSCPALRSAAAHSAGLVFLPQRAPAARSIRCLIRRDRSSRASGWEAAVPTQICCLSLTLKRLRCTPVPSAVVWLSALAEGARLPLPCMASTPGLLRPTACRGAFGKGVLRPSVHRSRRVCCAHQRESALGFSASPSLAAWEGGYYGCGLERLADSGRQPGAQG